MVDTVTLLQAIYDELKTVVQDNTSVSTPDDHVGLLDRTKDQQTPFFGFEWTMNPNPMGMGGNIRTVSVNTDSNGDIEGVERRRDYQLILDFGVTVDGDEPRTRDEYLGYLQSHFSDFVRDSSQLHADVHRVREDGAIPESVQGGDVGLLLTYVVEFGASDTVDIPAAENVDWGVDADGTDAYPEQY